MEPIDRMQREVKTLKSHEYAPFDYFHDIIAWWQAFLSCQIKPALNA